ncbi:MAG TPA: hypothetical protein VF613_15810 [Longimicrobium sp.]
MATPPQESSAHEPAVRPWEIELLISLSVTFALLQLPGQVDAVFAGMEPRLDRGMRMMAFIGYQAVKLPLYLMIAAFLLHLAVRAYWVGLIGMEAVFPRGIRWDELKYGPVTKEVQRERVGSLQPMIDRADRLGSIIFSTSFAMVVTAFYALAMAIVAGGVSFAISSLFLGGRRQFTLFNVVLFALIVPAILVAMLDRHFGERLAEGSRARRWLRRGAVLAYYTSGTAATGAVWLILFSNLRRRTVSTVLTVIMVGLFGFFIVNDILLRKGALTVDSYAYLPQTFSSRSMDHSTYENLRPDGGDYQYTPSINADVVSGPYLKLFIPYPPARLNSALRDRCPGLPVLGGGGLRMPMLSDREFSDAEQERVLACWARVQPVKLNGKPFRPGFRFYTHPRTGLRGAIAYIPTAGLPAGENVLEVAALPRPNGRPRPPYVIPFWR